MVLLLRCLLLLATVTGLSLATSAAADEPTSSKSWVYYGPYTAKGKSVGIYRSEFDAKTGELSKPELAVEVGSPSFLHIAPDGKTLYAVGESGGQDGGGVYSWKLDKASGKLSDQVSLTSKGSGPCHISTDAKSQFAVVANYGGGSTAFFKLNDDGSLFKRTGFVQHAGKGPDKRQNGPHAHCGFFDPTGTVVAVCDLGLDKVLLYGVDAKSGAATFHAPAAIKLPDGSGPRHIHIHPTLPVAFVNGELDMTVNLLKFDVTANEFDVKQSLSTLPKGEAYKPSYSTAEVRIHPNGKFVYVSNRGHNTVAVFAFDDKATSLTAVGHITGDIKTPRNFNISPCGNWMLIASQDGGKVGVYAISTATGLAKETAYSAKIDSCVCVKFAAK